MRLGVSPTAASTPTGVFDQWFEGLFPHTGTLGWAVCLLVHPLLPSWQEAALPTQLHNPPPCWVHQLLPPWPAAALPTLLHNLPPHWVCQPTPCSMSSLPSCPSPPLLRVWMSFFFISVVVGLPYSLIFCQFWLFFVFKLLLSFWLCEEAQCVYVCLHLGQKSPSANILICGQSIQVF